MKISKRSIALGFLAMTGLFGLLACGKENRAKKKDASEQQAENPPVTQPQPQQKPAVPAEEAKTPDGKDLGTKTPVAPSVETTPVKKKEYFYACNKKYPEAGPSLCWEATFYSHLDLDEDLTCPEDMEKVVTCNRADAAGSCIKNGTDISVQLYWSQTIPAEIEKSLCKLEGIK